MKLMRFVPDMSFARGRISWGWGYAWYDPVKCGIVTFPIPLNLVLGGLRKLYWRCMTPRWKLTERDILLVKIKELGQLVAEQREVIRLNAECDDLKARLLRLRSDAEAFQLTSELKED